MDTNGNMSVWINDAKNAFAAVASAADNETTNLEIFGRCLLFEDDGYTMMEQLDPAVQEKIIDLKQFNPFGVSSDDETPIAIERIKNMTGTGSFLVYTSLTDGSGASVKLNSVYNDDPSGDVVDGFYTVLTVIDLEDVKKYNAALNSLAEEQGGDETEVNE